MADSPGGGRNHDNLSDKGIPVPFLSLYLAASVQFPCLTLCILPPVCSHLPFL